MYNKGKELTEIDIEKLEMIRNISPYKLQNQIKKVRCLHNISIEDLCKKINMSSHTLQAIESHYIDIMDFRVIEIASALGYNTVDEFSKFLKL